MTNKHWRKWVLPCVGGVLLVLGVGYGLLRLKGNTAADACISEELGTAANLYGAKIEIVSTNCDTLIKDEAVRVYISRGAVERGLFAKWRRHRELIFDYVPAIDERPPAIEASGQNRISISVSNVSHVFVQRRTWQNIFIDYRIGRIIDP